MSQDPSHHVDPSTNVVPPVDSTVDAEGDRFHRFGETGGADEAGDTEGHGFVRPRTLPQAES